MKKLIFALLLTLSGCVAEFDVHPTQAQYQHYRWCWHTFYHPACFMTMSECESDATAHDLECVTPCRRERYFSNER